MHSFKSEITSKQQKMSKNYSHTTFSLFQNEQFKKHIQAVMSCLVRVLETNLRGALEKNKVLSFRAISSVLTFVLFST